MKLFHKKLNQASNIITYTLTLIFVFFILFFNANKMSAQTPVTFDSLYSFKTVRGLQLSPNGKLLIYTTRKTDSNTSKSTSQIWIMDIYGKNKKQILKEKKSVWNLRWIEKGKKLAFVSGAKQSTQVYTFTISTGDIKQITNYKYGISNFVWSPAGKGLAFTSRVYPENNSKEFFIKKKKQLKSVKHTGKLYETLLYRPYSKWDDGTVSHIFYYSFEDKSVIDVTPGKECAPASHLGGNDVQFSADGITIAFTMNTDPVKAISTNNDIYTVSINGKNRKQITTGKGNDLDPRFSPDGKYLLYLEMANAQYEADQKNIILINLKNGRKKNLTSKLDRTLRSVTWLPNSKYIYFSYGDSGYRVLSKINVKTGKIYKLLDNVVFYGTAIDPGGKNAYMIKSYPDKPGEIFSFNIKKKSFKQLTDYSFEFTKKYTMGTNEVFWYKGGDGDQVQGFLTFPPNYDKSKKYPMVMIFHGGPEGAWNNAYSNYGGNAHLISNQGYIVAKINPHGSNSYGLAFQKRLLGSWGDIDVEDVIKGLDYLIKTYPEIDENKVAGMGRSYGGFLVNMLNGKTDRFKCFISVDGLFDQVMSYYTTDELWFPETEFKGTPLSNPEIYKKSSPVTYAKNFKTPALIIHGGRDYRVDPSQGFAMYTALLRQGIPAQLLFFPDEPHYFRKLETWRYNYEIRFKWLKKWLK